MATNWKSIRCARASSDPANHAVSRAVHFANRLMGFPRHLSQHVGGFVLTRDKLDWTVPIGPAAMDDRYFIEWDKDDLDTLAIMKVDVLALGMLTCIRKAFDLIHAHAQSGREPKLLLATVPQKDPAVYDMLCKADAIGVFQVESRAQMNMLPRLRPRKFYDLVVEVAIVRPGPIQGGMVHPYLKRRANRDDPDQISLIPSRTTARPDELYDVLNKTTGRAPVPGTGDAAGHRRRQIHAPTKPMACAAPWRPSAMSAPSATFEEKFIGGMTARGYDPAFRAKPVSSRSRASAVTAFPKAMPPASRCWSMSRPGSRSIIPPPSPRRCSIPSPWAFMPRPRSCAAPAIMA